MFELVASIETSKKAWDLLQKSFGRVDKVKKTCLQTLISQFEALKQENTESITDYFSQVIEFVHQMRRKGENIPELHTMEKNLRLLMPKYRMVALTNEESKDLEEMFMEQLMGYHSKHTKKY